MHGQLNYPNLSEQTSMFADKKGPHFYGPDYIPKLDQKRLSTQFVKIRDLMLDGKWRTLGEIESITRYPQASISAQLRHLRKSRFGSYIVNKQRRKLSGLFEYQLIK